MAYSNDMFGLQQLMADEQAAQQQSNINNAVNLASMKKEIDDVIYMQENLKGWGGAESVIGNMATANMGAMAGKSIGGEAGGILGGILSITQCDLIFQNV